MKHLSKSIAFIPWTGCEFMQVCHGQGKIRENKDVSRSVKSQGKSLILSKSMKSQGIIFSCTQNSVKSVKSLKMKSGIFKCFAVFCRIMVAIMTGIGVLWIPVVQNVQGGQLFIYIQAVSAYFSPPIAALYLLSILWTKATEKVCTE